jgi:creatinine amidohydrolase
MHRKGTLTLKKETFLAVVFEICESLQSHGVKNILILNGHGGNVRPLRDSVADFREKLGINVQFNSYWDAYTREIKAKHMESKTAPGHAAEFETSFALAAFPERVHWEGVDYQKAKPHLAVKNERDAEQDERYAREAKLATSAKGEAMINISVDFVVQRLRKIIAEG